MAGLGNPGPAYALTRHNVGFRVVERVAHQVGGHAWRDLGHSLVSEAQRDGWRFVLAKPSTFMNRSGTALAALAAVAGIDPAGILVVVDDIDLPLGRLRLRPSGGPGSHNGLRDIVGHLGPGFARLRLGVRGEEPWQDLAEYVLTPFDGAEEEAVERMVARAAEAVLCVLDQGVRAAMNAFNRAPAEE